MRRTLLLILSLLGAAFAQHVELEQEVFAIARELRCPVCRAESAADSNATTSVEFRGIIRELLAEGHSREEILAYFTARYGDWILLEPPRRGIHLVVWVLPILAVLAGVTLLALLVRRWTRAAAAPIEVDAEGLERVQRELTAGPEHAPEGAP
ncbi:cytochrome c-type biogenesis protein [Truepera radiovictrix]|uniref:Cytochrome c-type biogenesis protein n=1 Tax=Truepera radiovictrix (strain DSM 17093 / CIP 108686 / LMG 22925 / RQ-24) TaxID=649638 RepID=D7CRR0_TRURR|nr:cytochrome c-type biogenesis protein [Truepera radiovictrix]ADI13550.1 cytochrome C biogenesis protein [Truepera radiovictrix DSM 17093]WMT57887.1 cytochrome c-type biogenesis protein CcmH [Truepera radiovictrix]